MGYGIPKKFGQQGYGYNIEGLYNEISAILGLDQSYKMVVVGVGNLGTAIANHTSYYKTGFVIDGIFEVSPSPIENDIVEVLFQKNLAALYLQCN